MSSRILVVEDEAPVRRTLTRYLARLGYEVAEAGSGEEALEVVDGFDPQVIITDYRMPGMNGLEVLTRARHARPGVDVVVVTGAEEMQTAVDAIKAGAFDYLAKPLELEQLGRVVERCVRDRSYRDRLEADAREAAGSYAPDQLVGRHPRMIEIFKLIGTLAQSRTPVLIRGESGTGKELIARAIHFNSPAAQQPFLPVNCSSLTEDALESEVFGHARGSSPAATADRRGRLELAGSGTVFLDEVSATGARFQAGLLRVLGGGEYFPRGGEKPRRAAARVIAATHASLEEEVAAGRFQQDLYSRLRGAEVVVPPLRERKEDIPRLARHLLARVTRELHKDVRVIPDEVLQRLLDYPWPGNVRELENALTRAVVTARGKALTLDDLALDPRPRVRGDDVLPEGDTLEAVEKAHVQRILYRMKGNKRRSARVLAISRPRLDRMIEKYDLDVPGSLRRPAS